MEYSNNYERKSRSNRVTDAPPWTASPNAEVPLVPTYLTNVASASNLGRKLATMKSSSQKDWLRYAMEALKKVPLTFATIERKWLLPLLASTLISVVLLLLVTLSVKSSDPRSTSIIPVAHALDIVVADPASELPPPPRLAYLISGTKGDGERMQRTLRALYHPRNYYLLHLDLEAPARERLDLARYVKSEVVFGENANVYVVGRANLVTYRGPTMIAATLHGAAILLKKAPDWDWFINLSAADYPLITQDDLLHVFSYLPRDLNFIEHTSDIGWKEFQRAKPIIIDPGLFQNKKTDIFWVTQRRTVPTAFRLFTGAYSILTSRRIFLNLERNHVLCR